MNTLMKPSHQDKTGKKLDFIEQWLPPRYTTSVNIILKKEPKDPAYIRKVRKKKLSDEKVIDALYKVSLINKFQKENNQPKFNSQKL
ncbi:MULTISPECIES: hypothetical protein [Chryseobacterium]|uniref:Uncharacterized protein n=1 Tax=Chryseobacterium nepalense TaxID=1854498 RepID=A0ABY4K4E4_9FLAO|nr:MULTISPECIES: hypothetical protein [Chryseobacterium]MEA1847441.1 hypothetical protein [Chryseobacterium sp. MHB01]UPQ75654.1 hypothetical protein M0D58_16595 [Chryseobacterium nepalense]